MACLVDPVIINRKYVKLANENNEPLESYSDREDYYVHIPCRRCINCVNSYMTMWRNRLLYEFEYMSSDARRNSYFTTLTFRDNVLKSDSFDLSRLKKRFIDRIRKDVGSSPRHWMVTEFGEKKKRLHIHALFFDVNFDIYRLEDYWQYGIVDYSQMTENSIKYCTSYITKGNVDIIVPPYMIQRVFCSPGIGKSYCDDTYNKSYHHPSPGILNPLMQNSSQFIQAMPRYFKHKIFTPDELEDMTTQFFMEFSEDVIPDPPYIIGKRRYTDFTEYKNACKEFISEYKKYYKPKKMIFNGE